MEEVTQIDYENSRKHGISQSKAQANRIRFEKRIKDIIALDEYLNFIHEEGYKELPRKIKKVDEYKEMKWFLKRYPFDGNHFKCDVSTYCAALDKKRFERFKKATGIEADLADMLALDNYSFLEATRLRKTLIKLRRINTCRKEKLHR